MAPGLDTDSQFKFLIACIKHSNGGKPDFVAVANELEIVSKAAAAKRYERLMKAHNISTKTPLGPSAGASATKESTPAKARATKKRKVQASDDEEDEAPAPVKKEAKVKKETKAKKGAKAKVKEEVKEESEPSDVDDVVEDEPASVVADDEDDEYESDN